MAKTRHPMGDSAKKYALASTAVRQVLLDLRTEAVDNDKEIEIQEFGILTSKDEGQRYRNHGFDLFGWDPRTVLTMRQPKYPRSEKYQVRISDSTFLYVWSSESFNIRFSIAWSTGLTYVSDDRIPGGDVTSGTYPHQRIGKTSAGVERIFLQYDLSAVKYKMFLHVDGETNRFFFGDGGPTSAKEWGSIGCYDISIPAVTDESEALEYNGTLMSPLEGDPGQDKQSKLGMALLRWMCANRTGGNNTTVNYPEDLLP